MRDSLDGIPRWTDHGKEGGLDPLAMLRPIEALYQSLLEGLSSVTIRLRYYSFLTWWVRQYQYRESNPSTKASEFTKHIRAGEALIGLVSKAAGQPDGVAGDLEITKLMASSGEVIDLQDAADRYLKKPVYFGVYGTQMAEMGILSRGVRHNFLVPTADIGEDLAAAYEDAIGNCRLTFIACCKKLTVTRDELASMEPMRNEFVDPYVGSSETELLRKLLLGHRGKGSRRATCIEILSSAQTSGTCPTDYDLRFKWMTERPSEIDRNYIERHLWMHFQIADSLRVAYEALLRHCGLVLRSHSGGLSPLELAAEVASDIPGDVTLEEYFFSIAAAQSDISVQELQEKAIKGCEKLAPVSAFIAILWSKWAADLEDMKNVFPQRGHFTTSALEIEYINVQRHRPANEAFGDLLLNRIIRRHLFVASRKLRTQGNNTFQFEYEVGSLAARRLGEVGPASPRTGTAIRFMREMGLLSSDGITKLGQSELQQP